jgi:hypothetical protein
VTTVPATVTIDLGPGSPRVDAARAQLAHLFPAADVDLHIGYGPPPPGHRVVDAWRVIPSTRVPLFLVPVDPAAARRLLVSHNGLRGPKVRAARTAASVAVAGIAVASGRRGILTVSVPAGVDDAQVDDAVVTRHLRRRVPGAAATAISLRAFHPLAKPTVQVADAGGRIVAFTKVASDVATAGRVEREARLMRELGAELDGPVRLPRVLDEGRCGPFTVSVVEPLPQRTIGAREQDGDRVMDRLAAFQAAGDAGRSPLQATALWRELAARVETVTGPAGPDSVNGSAGPGSVNGSARPDLADALLALVAAVRRDDADRELAVGAFHGDWVPWNMGWADDVLWVWDLEYGSRQGPVGLDALRWVYQLEHVVRRRSLTDAVAAMTAAAPRLLPRVGADPADTRALVRVHLTAVFATALGALAAGRGLPPGLDPDAVAVLAEHAR